jgi:hypothetical protein
MADTQTTTSPHISDGATSPLDVLARRALRRYGEMSPSTVEADTILGFLDYANEIIDDVLAHPYTEKGTSIPYATHQSEKVSAIPDHIFVSGMLFRHARDQKSKATARFEGDYYQKLNQLMTRVKFGVGAQFEMQAVDVEGGGVK